ncbi:hypothetical protein PF005_g2193 [Phytophthora fragariae]|uniref:Oxidation resistance protein 1 n=1 Tax=Phytophthora fragariae TaxID=53985 RepID=A0A6A4ENW7_9STRA|nr:hypothetical protein PF009_g2495 [Phytophthora fragariae]KAE9028296.1 hypothetical protein PF011_g1620 [Phytophthora fragariae]KAE9135881.1 hypothetical protein PF010_g1893 [Phytophthora fragariae]KAE9136252.1 hypothetical protein PF007_g2249 [Phytophthora fragariae]KAE9154146.1 hypothetical protein PF006_g1784 [Phytophthora fragariae]
MSRLFTSLSLDESRTCFQSAHASKRDETLRNIAERFHMQESELPDINNFGKQVVHATVEVLRAFERKARSNSLPERIDSDIVALDLHTDDLHEICRRQMGNHFTFLKRSKSLQPEENEATRLAKERRRKLLQPELPKLIGGSKNEVLSNPRNASTLVPQLQASLAPSRRCHDWKLLYSLAQDGCSLHTLLRKAKKQNPTLETTKGDIFGGFASEEWQDSANYYGIGESFVFSFSSKFECYPWSYLNTMIMLSNDECIAMGGGGDFARCLNSDLSRGTSGCSKTFENERLTSEAEFGIYNVEVWGFVTKI